MHPTSMTDEQRTHRAARARGAMERLSTHDIVGVAVTWVDNSGVTRVKTVPPGRLEHAAVWGIGASPVFDAFLLDDSIMSGRHAGSPVGDLRLHPDPDRTVVLAAQPGWAWAPADRYTQDGAVHPQCARSFLQRMTDGLGADGFTALTALEVEWTVGREGGDDFVPACTGPAYGMTRVIELSDYARDLLSALVRQGVEVDQFHPEYGAGQLELSVAAEDPVSAADTNVLVRQTIRAVGMRHQLRTSFSPKVLPDGVGNGAHVHLSLSEDGTNQMGGGDRPGGLRATGAGFVAGILARLPGLLAIGAPSAASYLRLVPSHWAGAFGCWGVENRETAIRLIPGSAGSRDWSANVEVKCVDAAANPYLLIGALLAAGRAGVAEGTALPDPIEVDPAELSDQERSARGVVELPGDLESAADALEADPVLTEALGLELSATIADLRRAEAALTAQLSPTAITDLARWKY